MNYFIKNITMQKKNDNTLKDFYKKHTKEEILKRNLIVPEIAPEIVPYILKDSKYFNVPNDKSIFILKHYCYLPSFKHYHEFFEINYVLEGTCTQLIHGQRINLVAGDLCLIAPNIEHTMEVFDESTVINILICRSIFDDVFFNILRDDNIISKFFVNNLHSNKRIEYILFHTFNNKKLRNQILEMYYEQCIGDTYSNRILPNMITIFFNHLLRECKDSIEIPDLVKNNSLGNFNILNFIYDNYKDVTLSMVASHFNFSIPYCSKLIKINTNQTFSELLRNIKLNKAESLLCDTNIPISSISSYLGYQNKETFTRIFKKYYSTTPSNFRNKYHTKTSI